MIVPNMSQGLEQHFCLLALLHMIIAASWEDWYNLFVGKLIEILGDKLVDAVIQCLSTPEKHHIVREPVVFLER